MPPFRKAETAKSWFKEREGEHLPWPAQSPYFNIIELLWSVLDDSSIKMTTYSEQNIAAFIQW
jgi:hypothetical protein